jgi:5-deoxy-glucuronate isomerase
MSVFEKNAAPLSLFAQWLRWEAVAETDCVIALCTAPGKGGHAARRIGPEGITLTERGKGANTRYINNIAMENEIIATVCW